MKIVIITQKVDFDDDLLGTFVAWINALAKRVDYVEVITLAKGNYTLPNNVKVRSLGKEHGDSKAVQFFRFYFYLFSALRGADKLFAHMSPIFVIAAWPVAFLYRVPIILWYVHRSITIRLRLAVIFAKKVLTASASSFRLRSDKVVITGHGTDTNYFTPVVHKESDISTILAVGRISPIKNYETLLAASEILQLSHIKHRVQIVGRPIMSSDHDYFERLKNIVKEKKLLYIEFIGFVPYSAILPYYNNATIAVNLAPTGGLDRAVLEAMSCGIPVLVANEGFGQYFGVYNQILYFKHGDADDLAQKIVFLAKHHDNSMSLYLRNVVLKEHSLEHLANYIINA